MRRLFYLFCFALLLQGCKNTEEFTGFSYDPEGVAVTTNKPIQPQHKRTIGIAADGIWVSNEFEGARVNNFFQLNDTLYQVVIKPENFPINNSPWYAFKAWAEQDTSIWIKLTYKHGNHRYYPNISHDRHNWQPIDGSRYRVDSHQGVAYLHLALSSKPIWVSAQELRTPSRFYRWADSLAQKSYVSQYTAGYSHQHRPVKRLTITEADGGENRGVIIIIGRQHPPEVTGNIACIAFIEELASHSELARAFRQQFEVIAYPFINPDGAANGYWRHNGGGSDLNRDWNHFNQPETQAVRDDLLGQLQSATTKKVYYGLDFHSTGQNIFYPINRNVDTFPQDFTYQWLDSLAIAFPEMDFAIEPFSTKAPIAKNWIYHTFGADAVTYEVADHANRQKLRTVAQKAARLMMKQLLAKKQQLSAE